MRAVTNMSTYNRSNNRDINITCQRCDPDFHVYVCMYIYIYIYRPGVVTIRVRGMLS